MPEIAEVARVTHFLSKHLIGKTISKVTAVDDANIYGKVGTSGAAFQDALTGKKVLDVGRQGKYFWIILSSPPHPVMHLGMTGWINIRGIQTGYTRYLERTGGADKEQWPPKFWKFHLETDSDPKVEVAFTDPRRFGRVRLVDCPGKEIRQHTPLVENGPDPVVDVDVFTEKYLREKTRGRHVPIKAFLLDQAMISGIGNWVGDEILYQAKLHPEQYSDDFSDADISTLYKAIKYVCDTAVEKLGDSDQFPEDWMFKYRWDKGKKDSAMALPNGEKITHIKVGGRTSCIVPTVQKKRGRTTIDDVKEESAVPDGEKESRFFKGKKKEQTNGKVKTEVDVEEEERPVKKVKTAKSKPIKREDEEEDGEEGETKLAVRTSRKSDKKDKGKESVEPPLDGSRRRSDRLRTRS